MIVHTGIMKSGTTWLELMVASLTDRKRVIMHGSHKWPEKILKGFLSQNRDRPFSMKDHFRPASHELFHGLELPMIFIYRHPADVVTSLDAHLELKFPEEHKGDFSYTLDMFNWTALQFEWTTLPGVFVTRYEDLLMDPYHELERVGEYLGTPLNRKKIRKTVEQFTFEKMFQRKRGEENSNHWGRKGIIGDHTNFLVGDRLDMWNERYPGIAEKWGYDDEFMKRAADIVNNAEFDVKSDSEPSRSQTAKSCEAAPANIPVRMRDRLKSFLRQKAA